MILFKISLFVQAFVRLWEPKSGTLNKKFNRTLLKHWFKMVCNFQHNSSMSHIYDIVSHKCDILLLPNTFT
jgi:hypothetical protein